jgi:hypothetical protein
MSEYIPLDKHELVRDPDYTRTYTSFILDSSDDDDIETYSYNGVLTVADCKLLKCECGHPLRSHGDSGHCGGLCLCTWPMVLKSLFPLPITLSDVTDPDWDL